MEHRSAQYEHFDPVVWRAFFQGMAQAAVSTGPESFLKEAAEQDELGYQRAAQAVWGACVRGVALQQAFEAHADCFPPVVLQLVCEALARGVLDYVMGEAAQALQGSSAPLQAYRALSQVLARWQLQPDRPTLCLGCTQNTLHQIVQRAELEGARDVFLSWDQDGYFVQSYLGPKLIRILEPSHAKTLRALVEYLTDPERAGEVYVGALRYTLHPVHNGVELRCELRVVRLVWEL